MNVQSKCPKLRHIDFMLVDMLALLLSFTAVFPLKFGGQWFLSGPDWSSAVWARLVLLFLLADAVITLISDPYSGILRRKYYMEIVRALQLTALNAISVALVLYIFKIGDNYSRTVFILTYACYFVLSLLMKYLWKHLIVTGKVRAASSQTIPLFVIAQRAQIAEILANVAAGDYCPYQVRGIHFAGEDAPGTYRGIPVCGADYAEQIIRRNIGDVLIALPPQMLGMPDYRRLTDNAVNLHISVESLIGMQTEDQFVSDLGVCRALSITAFSFRPGQLVYLGVKRMLDLLCGLLGLVLLLPVSAAVKLSYLHAGDRAGIFYTQKRVGQDGKPIRICKFRTMVPDAEKQLAQLLEDPAYRAEWEANQKLANDPRITRAGRLLRKTSVDELPQVLNLLRGDMSLVGPRPLVEGELESHGGLQLYQRVKPGITGWWACNGRSNIDYRERLELEYYYIKHFSMYLDILCVLRTVHAVLKKDGAA